MFVLIESLKVAQIGPFWPKIGPFHKNRLFLKNSPVMFFLILHMNSIGPYLLSVFKCSFDLIIQNGPSWPILAQNWQNNEKGNILWQTWPIISIFSMLLHSDKAHLRNEKRLPLVTIVATRGPKLKIGLKALFHDVIRRPDWNALWFCH